MNPQCAYRLHNQERCENRAIPNSRTCASHESTKCGSCGYPATNDHKDGTPLCDRCTCPANYLGDGVYVSLRDGCMLTLDLRAQEPTHDNAIMLEPNVIFQALLYGIRNGAFTLSDILRALSVDAKYVAVVDELRRKFCYYGTQDGSPIGPVLRDILELIGERPKTRSVIASLSTEELCNRIDRLREELRKAGLDVDSPDFKL